MLLLSCFNDPSLNRNVPLFSVDEVPAFLLHEYDVPICIWQNGAVYFIDQQNRSWSARYVGL